MKRFIHQIFAFLMNNPQKHTKMNGYYSHIVESDHNRTGFLPTKVNQLKYAPNEAKHEKCFQVLQQNQNI